MPLKVGGSSTEVITDALVAQNMTYTTMQPAATTDSAVTGTKNADMNGAGLELWTMTGATTITPTNEAAGRVKVILLDTNTTGFTPTWSGIEWPEGGGDPSWATYRYWQVYLVSWSASVTRGSAIGFST